MAKAITHCVPCRNNAPHLGHQDCHSILKSSPVVGWKEGGGAGTQGLSLATCRIQGESELNDTLGQEENKKEFKKK